MKHLYFCRHGLSEDNVTGLVSSRTDSPLTNEGRVQAKLAGEYARQLELGHIIASPLSRAHDTARIIANQIGYPENKIELNSLIMERDFGSLEGTIWSPDLNLDGISDAETHESLEMRVRLAWEYIQTLTADNVLVVGHGSTGRMLRHIVNPAIPFRYSDSADRAKHKLHNAQIIQFA